MRNRPLIIALAVMGLLAVGLTAMTLINSGNSGASTTEPDPNQASIAAATPAPTITKQVVAIRDIPPRTLITRAMLTEREVSSDSVAPSAFSKIEDAVGKLSNVSTIRQGQPLTLSSVVTPLQRVVPANFEVPAGLRAVAVYVDPNSTAAGLVDIGDRVDAIATNKVTFKAQDTDRYKQVYAGVENYAIGRTVAQDLLVLAVDTSLQQQPTPTPAPAAPTAPGAPAPPPPTPSPTPGVVPKIRVVLAAAPAVAARLIAAQGQGELNLIIRNPNSREKEAPVEVREYPTRVYNVAKRSENADTGSSSAPQRDIAAEMRAMRAASESNLKTPDVPPLTPLPPAAPKTGETSTGDAGATVPVSSEVTVIRGTDKSKVTVPSN